MTTSTPGSRPAGYVPWPHPSPLLTALGDLWCRQADPLQAGFTADATKLNGRGFLHAGAIRAVADTVIGHGLGTVGAADARHVTIDLRATFLGIVPAGAWVEVAVAITRAGRRLSAGGARFTSDGRLVATADALFLPIGQDPRSAEGGGDPTITRVASRKQHERGRETDEDDDVQAAGGTV